MYNIIKAAIIVGTLSGIFLFSFCVEKASAADYYYYAGIALGFIGYACMRLK